VRPMRSAWARLRIGFFAFPQLAILISSCNGRATTAGSVAEDGPKAAPTPVSSVPSSDQNAHATSGGPACADNQFAVYEPGCDELAQTRCVGPESLPVVSDWCGCDGRTVQSPSNFPPQNVRYRFEGPCKLAVRLRVQADPTSTSNQIVWFSVGSTEQEVGRYPGPCKAAASVEPDLIRMTCGDAGKGTLLRVRRDGAAVVVDETTRPPNQPPTSRQVVGRNVPEGAEIDVQ
jgi:hypothetical protein